MVVVHNPPGLGVHVFLPVNEVERTKCTSLLSQSNSVTYGGGDMLVGEAHVVMTHDFKESNSISSCCYAFVPCETASDDNAANCFEDRFYGTRGETPTTLIQWSKGTSEEKKHQKLLQERLPL